ncbi:type II toxin-antitoxin system RelE/ParE family toxin [Nonomuraea purpurea]|uniref:Type II toxin-antitoxin system RelE/ParE family toxin n=1 Tax=Nonomuraea purpurea TaxID=1849276 RepID=A0ABV8G2H7_9ACTN
MNEAIDLLAETGPAPGRPLVDTLKDAQVANLKAGIAGAQAFDPWREAILLIGGDKSGNWAGWYREWIPWAEARYEQYLKEREAEEGQR